MGRNLPSLHWALCDENTHGRRRLIEGIEAKTERRTQRRVDRRSATRLSAEDGRVARSKREKLRLYEAARGRPELPSKYG